MKLWGIVGNDALGVAGLLSRLAAEFIARGISVSTVRQADPGFDVDAPGKDSFRHREAGATEVLLASRRRWALMHEHRDEAPPGLDTLLAELAPVDLVLIEGFATDPHPKIAHRQAGTAQTDRTTGDPTVRAIAAAGIPETGGIPAFDPDDTAAIADFIADNLWLGEYARPRR